MTPIPKFLGAAEAYFVCRIDPIFQISLIHAFNRAATAAKNAKDWSLPSFGSHLNPISTRGEGGRLCLPYTGVLGWLKFAMAALLAGVSLPKLEFILTVFSTAKFLTCLDIVGSQGRHGEF